MRRFSAVLLLLSLFLLPLLSACSNDKEAEIDTDFGKMLKYVPTSFLEERDVWFGNPAHARQVYDAEDISNVEELLALLEDKGRKVNNAFNASLSPAFTSGHMQVAPLDGWNGFMIDRAMYHETPPPWTFSVSEGEFDDVVIGEKLREQGYEETTYGTHAYYQKNDDMQIIMMNEINSWMQAKLNRVAVSDNVVITAPATDIMTGILDAMSGDTESLEEKPSCRALSQEMGDVFYAVLIPRERIMQLSPKQTQGPFDLEAASGWEPLHEWETVSLGVRDDGTNQYFVISLYYTHAANAEADTSKLVSRMQSYAFGTMHESMERVDMPSAYEIGEAIVTPYGDGATVTVSCLRLENTRGMAGSPSLLIEMRDLLFLVPDPSPYLSD